MRRSNAEKPARGWVFKEDLQTDKTRISRGHFAAKSLAWVEVDGVGRCATARKGR